MNYEELVKALRYCSTTKGMVYCNVNCKYGWEERSMGCKDLLMEDAAAAIEELQAEQKKTVTQIFCEEQMAWEGRCKDLMIYISDLQAEVKRLEPKRGEWVHLYKNNFRCSLCGSWFIFEDENNPYEDGRFCSYCGAKMTEVQE